MQEILQNLKSQCGSDSKIVMDSASETLQSLDKIYSGYATNVRGTDKYGNKITITAPGAGPVLKKSPVMKLKSRPRKIKFY